MKDRNGLISKNGIVTVCDRVGQGLAQVKNIDSLKLRVSGFSRALMTIG
ncbi:hypothetical protein PRIPAC_74205 [Pristionchus pacificus]|uniref:Uncharacterized protein n=1 Tax=Pristionchus pacificus TaxID=54126 RepID=A0A2A6CR09_PRIPA|nr:hypothetical protein PRIPAC_74205 [Pristionchus pacificus]|eukprot:PDM80654.1 hypothetical protein PRIPAC_35657 [Pristionchus pacificus]